MTRLAPRRPSIRLLWGLLAVLLLCLPLISAAEGLELETESAIGDRLAVAAFERIGPPLDPEPLQAYVNRVGAAVGRTGAPPDLPLYFAVVDSPIRASFACPGGIILVTRGLMDAMADESELAGVLAHEIAHLTGRHIFLTFTAQGLDNGVTAYEELIDRLADVLFRRGLSPKLEHAADAAAMNTAYRTGYDPGGLLRLLTRLSSESAGPPDPAAWSATHPPLSDRIARCRKSMTRYPDAGQMARVADRFEAHRP